MECGTSPQTNIKGTLQEINIVITVLVRRKNGTILKESKTKMVIQLVFRYGIEDPVFEYKK